MPLCLLLRLGYSLGRRLRLLQPALEALDPATGVDELLLARVEGVALRAELDAERGDGRAGGELVPAGAVHLALDVVGVDSGLHDPSSLEERRRPNFTGSGERNTVGPD